MDWMLASPGPARLVARRSIGIAVLTTVLWPPTSLPAQTLSVAAEGTSNSSSPTQVSGPLPVMTVSNTGVCNGMNEATCQSFIAFDLSSLPPATSLDNAVLRLSVADVVTPGTIDVVPVLEA